MKHFTLTRAAAALSLGAALLVGGAASAQDKTKLTIGSSVQSLFSLPLYIAKSKGFFDEAGLEVEVVNFRGGATATPALVGGSTQLQAAGTENLLKLVNAGQPVQAVMGVQSTLNGAIVIRKDLADKVGPKPTVQQLKGMSIGTLARGGTTDIVMRYMFKEAGLDPDRDARLMPILGYDKHIAAMQARELDVSVPVEPAQTLMVDSVKNAVYFMDFLAGEGPETFQNMNWITLQGKTDYIKTNRATVEKVVRAMIKAQTFIADKKNLDEVTKLAKLEFTEIPEDLLRRSIEKQLHTYTPEVTPEGIKKNNDLLIGNQALPGPVAYEKAVDTSFNTLWKEFKRP